MFTMKAYLPVAESFGFNADLRSATGGQGKLEPVAWPFPDLPLTTLFVSQPSPRPSSTTGRSCLGSSKLDSLPSHLMFQSTDIRCLLQCRHRQGHQARGARQEDPYPQGTQA